MRRTFGNVSYYFSSQPERALDFAQFFPLSVYDRFNLVLFGPFQPPAQASKTQYVTTSFKILHLLILRIALHSVLYGLNGKKKLRKISSFWAGFAILS